jgi:hypothetical protein
VAMDGGEEGAKISTFSGALHGIDKLSGTQSVISIRSCLKLPETDTTCCRSNGSSAQATANLTITTSENLFIASSLTLAYINSDALTLGNDNAGWVSGGLGQMTEIAIQLAADALEK